VDIIKSAATGFIGGAIGEAAVEIKRYHSIDPSKIIRSAVVGAIIAPANKLASAGLRSAFGLPLYKPLPKAGSGGASGDENWAAATD
jgi:hypothetical protein